MDKYDVLHADELENVDVIALFEQSPQMGDNQLMAIYIPTARELFEGKAIERDVAVDKYWIELIPTTKLLDKLKRMELFFIEALNGYMIWCDDTFDELYDMIMDDLVWSKEGKELLCKNLYFTSRSIAIGLAGKIKVGEYRHDRLRDALCMFNGAINGDISLYYNGNYDDSSYNEDINKAHYLSALNTLIKRMDSDKFFHKFVGIAKKVSLKDVEAYHDVESRLINYTMNRAKCESVELDDKDEWIDATDDIKIDGTPHFLQPQSHHTIVILDDYPFINQYINSDFETYE